MRTRAMANRGGAGVAAPGGARDGKVLIGCLVVLVLLIVLIVGGVVYVAMSWKGWAADIGQNVATELIEDSDLPDEEKTQVIAQINELAAGFKSGDISFEEMGQIFEKLAESPLLPAAIVYEAHEEYFVEASDLSDEELEQSKVALARLAQGVFDESISPATLQDVFEPIESAGGAGRGVHIDHPQFKLHLKPPEDCTDEELRQVIANAVAAADEAGVPAQPPSIDVSDEIQKAIDSVTGGADDEEAAEEAEAPAVP